MANLDKNYDTALSAGMKESLMFKALSTLVPPLPSINTPLEPPGFLEILNPFIHTNHLTELKYFFHNRSHLFGSAGQHRLPVNGIYMAVICEC